MRQRRAVLLCGQQRSLVAAVGRELSGTGVQVVIQAARAEAPDARLRFRSADDCIVVVGELGGEVASRKLAAAAWSAAPGIDTVVVCPPIAPSGGRRASGLHAWDAALTAGVKAPVFLAQEIGRRWRRAKGRLVFAIDGASGDGAVAEVVRSGLLTMVEALSRSLPAGVAVAAVVAGGRPDTGEIARRVAELVAGSSPRSGTVLEIGGLPRRG